MKQLILSVSVELPDDFLEASRAAMALSDPWLALCQALRDSGVQHETRTEHMEVRSKAKRGPRKAKLAPVDTAA